MMIFFSLFRGFVFVGFFVESRTGGRGQCAVYADAGAMESVEELV